MLKSVIMKESIKANLIVFFIQVSLVEGDVYLEGVQKSFPHNPGVEVYKIHLFAQFHGNIILLFEQVAIDVCKFFDVVASPLGLFLLH